MNRVTYLGSTRVVSPPRKTTLFKTVQGDSKVPEFSISKRVFCKHEEVVIIGWTDHSAGPGWMSDSYETRYCTNCGTTVKTIRTY